MRPNPSEQMTDAFRRLMAQDFYAIDPDTGEVLEGEDLERILAMTKPWRAELWRAFQPIDDGLNPIRAFHAGRLDLRQ